MSTHFQLQLSFFPRSFTMVADFSSIALLSTQVEKEMEGICAENTQEKMKLGMGSSTPPPATTSHVFRLRFVGVHEWATNCELELKGPVTSIAGADWQVILTRFAEQKKGQWKNYLQIRLSIVSDIPSGCSWAITDKYHLHSQTTTNLYSLVHPTPTNYSKEKSTWAVQRFIEYNEMYSTVLGYVVNDSILLSVDLTIFTHHSQMVTLPQQIVTQPETTSHVWRLQFTGVNAFLSNSAFQLKSQVARMAGADWQITLIKFYGQKKKYGQLCGQFKNFMKIRLDMVSNDVPNTWSWAVLDKYHLHSQTTGNIYSEVMTAPTIYTKERSTWSVPRFIDHDEMYCTVLGYVVNDTILLTAELMFFIHHP